MIMRRLLILLALLLGVLPARAQDATFGYNPCAAAQGTSCIVKPAAGLLMGFRVTNWGAAVVVYLVDSATVPTAGGAAVTPVASWPLAAGTANAPTERTEGWYPDAIQLTKGIVLLCSSTGIPSTVPTYTAASTCTFEAETR
jgi:hypothetical protein